MSELTPDEIRAARVLLSPLARPAIVKGAPLPVSTRKHSGPVNRAVLHESVTWTREDCVDMLRRRGLGVHYSVAPDGSIHQHVDWRRRCDHAGPGNNRSVAVEYINRYYGEHASAGQTVIRAVWAHGGKYILPTPAQVEAGYRLTRWFLLRRGLDVAPVVADESPGEFRWARARSMDHDAPGFVAHHRWEHADALFPEHYSAARALGWSPADAWAMTVKSASSGRRVTALVAPEPASVVA